MWLVVALALTSLVGPGSLSASALGTITTLPANTFTWGGSKSATLSPTTGWTALSTSSQDDRALNIALGFNVTFEGSSYNTIQVHSNTYIMFNNTNTTSALNDVSIASQYSGLTPSSPAVPSIHMCSKDNSYQYVYYRFENAGTQLRVRYEGNNSTSGVVGAPTIIYEALFTANSSVIDIGMGINSSCDQNSGLLGLTNGADTVLEATWPTATYSSGYTLSSATGVKNNDYRISAGPSVSSFTSTSNTYTSANTHTYTLTFSSSISGLAGSDFLNAGSASGCVFSPSSTSGTTFTITVTSCSEGTFSPQVIANSVTDGASTSGPTSNYQGKTINIDRTVPVISGVTAPANGNYAPTQQLNFLLFANESVTVTGTPRIQLTLGSVTRYAQYVSMSDSRTAIFRYTVAADQSETDLDGITSASPVDMNGGSIQDLAGNALVSFTFTPPLSPSVKVIQAPNAPRIDSIKLNNTSVVVSFTPGDNNGASVTNYKYSTNNGVSFTALSPADSYTPVTIPGLVAGTTYQIQLKAVSNLGDGLASASESATPTVVVAMSISLEASVLTAAKGTPITFTANVSQPGAVTFLWNNERIPGCIRKPATTSATCIWKPAVTGQWLLTAMVDPTDKSYVASYSQTLKVFVVRRVGKR